MKTNVQRERAEHTLLVRLYSLVARNAPVTLRSSPYRLGLPTVQIKVQRAAPSAGWHETRLAERWDKSALHRCSVLRRGRRRGSWCRQPRRCSAARAFGGDPQPLIAEWAALPTPPVAYVHGARARRGSAQRRAFLTVRVEVAALDAFRAAVEARRGAARAARLVQSERGARQPPAAAVRARDRQRDARTRVALVSDAREGRRRIAAIRAARRPVRALALQVHRKSVERYTLAALPPAHHRAVRAGLAVLLQ